MLNQGARTSSSPTSPCSRGSPSLLAVLGFNLLGDGLRDASTRVSGVVTPAHSPPPRWLEAPSSRRAT
jgi:hypothetical protein